MKKKKVALKSLQLDKATLLNLNNVAGGVGATGKVIKITTDDSLIPTTPNDPTKATFCFFCPPNLSLDAFCF